MQNIFNKFRAFIEKYILYIFICFGILLLIPYVSVFSSLAGDSTGGIIYRGILLAFLLILFLCGFISYKKIPNKPILICCFIYSVTQLITIFVSPAIKNIEIPAVQSIMAVASVCTNIASVFVILFLFEYKSPSPEKLNIITYFLLGTSIALCLYTYIFQYKEIGSVLTDVHGWNYQVTSIFTSKNLYGYFLLITSIYTVILALNSKKYWLYAFPVFFLFNCFLCRAKTSILFIFIILMCVLVYHIIKSWNTHKKQWIVALSVGTGLILILCFFTFVPGVQYGPFKQLNYFITKTILRDGVTVMRDRGYKLTNIIKAVDYPLGIMFGCGERITNYILLPSGGEIRGDDMYVTNYAGGGIVKFVLYLALAAFVIYKTIKIKGEHKFFSILFISVILLTGIFADNSIVGVCYTFLLTAPFIYNYPFKRLN